ncbi:Surface protein PspC [Schistosoma japonicum]|nr:Surface protein PspC [Schistosoma japonicum]
MYCSWTKPLRNTITGENCSTYDYNSEVKMSTKQRTPMKISNPLSGENVNTFMNTVTGENLQSYKITPIERNVTPRIVKERQNPLSGENVESYTYRLGESKRTVKKRGKIYNIRFIELTDGFSKDFSRVFGLLNVFFNH